MISLQSARWETRAFHEYKRKATEYSSCIVFPSIVIILIVKTYVFGSSSGGPCVRLLQIAPSNMVPRSRLLYNSAMLWVIVESFPHNKLRLLPFPTVCAYKQRGLLFSHIFRSTRWPIKWLSSLSASRSALSGSHASFCRQLGELHHYGTTVKRFADHLSHLVHIKHF